MNHSAVAASPSAPTTAARWPVWRISAAIASASARTAQPGQAPIRPKAEGSPAPEIPSERVRVIIRCASSVITEGVFFTAFEEDLAGQGEDLAVAQRHHVGGVRRAGDHRHLAGRLAGPDDPQELRLLAVAPAHHAQAARQQEVEAVGRVAGLEQGPAARQGHPLGVTRAARPHEQSGQRRFRCAGREQAHVREAS